ncbi:MAG: hypothetical protein HOW73_40930 [Polyangiaceae bacterium]|nr:hypothetical protein [Polyangiaceae bacterium]
MSPRRLLSAGSFTLLVAGCASAPATSATETPVATAELPAPAAEPPALAEPPSSPVEIRPATGAPPPSFRADGDLAEWVSPPSLETEGARGWLAFDARGLVIALEFRDASQSRDPIDVVVRTEPPVLPPVAFANQFGETEVPDDQWCVDNMQDDAARAKCKEWRADQIPRRNELLASFARTFWSGAHDSIFVEQHADGRRTLEGIVPIERLPALTTASIEQLRVEVPLPGRPHRTAVIDAKMTTPLAMAKPGTLLRHLLDINTDHIVYYEPDAPSTLHYLLNEWMGYQWEPELPSPSDVVVDLAAKIPVLTDGETLIEQVVAGPGFGWQTGDVLVSSRNGVVVDIAPIGGGRIVGKAHRNKRLELGIQYEGSASILGTGQCGACPMISVAILGVEPDGHFAQAVEVGAHGGSGQETVDVQVSSDLARVVFRYNLMEDWSAPDKVVGLEQSFVWNASAAAYREKTKSIKPLPVP